jgi:mono/diheme cytochrome c family protein
VNKTGKLILIGGATVLLIIYFTMIQGAANGEKLFKNQGCINCHSFKGKGGEACPDLTSVKNRRSDSWIRDQIGNSKQHNPNSMMPVFDNLSRGEINAIIRYLKS